MDLNEYFENTKGTGIFATADRESMRRFTQDPTSWKMDYWHSSCGIEPLTRTPRLILMQRFSLKKKVQDIRENVCI